MTENEKAVSESLREQSAEPLYRQLMERILTDIAQGRYPLSSKIPSERELGEMYQVSRVTVRRALNELTEQGVLKKRQGKGTFVSTPKICRDLRDVNSFHEACRVQGLTAGTQVIAVQVVQAEEKTQENLQLDDDRVLEIERLRTADGLPIMLEVNHFPLSYTYLMKENLNDSLYAILERNGITPRRGIHEISLCYATPRQARLLQVESGSALLLLREVVFDQHGRPLHTSEQVIRGDCFTFRI